MMGFFFNPMGANNHSTLQPMQRPNGTSKTIGSVVRGFKIGVTKWMHNNTTIHNVWQRNYWEHIVRNEPELIRIQQYIQNNPMQWELEKLNPECMGECKGEKFLAPTETKTDIREPVAEYATEAWMV